MTPTTTPACDLIGRQRIERVRYPVAASILRLNRASLYASAMLSPSPVVATAPMMLGPCIRTRISGWPSPTRDHSSFLRRSTRKSEARSDCTISRTRPSTVSIICTVESGTIFATLSIHESDKAFLSRLPLLGAHLVDDRRELLAEVAQRRLVLVREDGRLAGDAAPELVDALHDADRLAAEHHLAAGRLHRADRHHEHRPRLVAGLPVDVGIERRVVGGALEVDDVPARHRLAGDRMGVGGD